MKKKLFSLALVLVMLLGIVGCGNKNIEYQGIYELGGVKIKTYLMDNEIYYYIEGDAITTNGNAELNNNVIKLDNVSDNATLTFSEGKVILKTDYKYIKSGNYKKVGDYEKEDFYNDFYGEKEYLNDEINGIYTKNDIKVNVYRVNNNTIRVFYDLDGNSSDLQMNLEDNGIYVLEFFDDIYNIKFENEKMTIDLKTEDSEHKVLNGTYTKESNLGLDEIIATYSPN